MDRVVSSQSRCVSWSKPKSVAFAWYKDNKVIRAVFSFQNNSDGGDLHAEYCYRKSRESRNPHIKALTIRQPWAELILRGRKPFELRSWRTKYRGPLVIHAAARIDIADAQHFGLDPDKLVTSAFVGAVVLSDVRPHTREDARLLKERRAGYGWFPGNFSWVLKKPRRISPVKGKGQLSLFKVPKAVERRVASLRSVGR